METTTKKNWVAILISDKSKVMGIFAGFLRLWICQTNIYACYSVLWLKMAVIFFPTGWREIIESPICNLCGFLNCFPDVGFTFVQDLIPVWILMCLCFLMYVLNRRHSFCRILLLFSRSIMSWKHIDLKIDPLYWLHGYNIFVYKIL